MSEFRSINILHISDLHFTRAKSGFSQSVVLDALRRDLSSFAVGRRSPDLVIFSGDLVHAADEEDIYGYLFDDFLFEITQLARCSEERIVLCPGNHDAHRLQVKKDRKQQEQISKNLGDREKLNTAYLQGELESFTERKFKSFFDSRSLFAQPNPDLSDALVSLYHFDDLSIDVITINTAWMSRGGNQNWAPDERKLLFPEAALYNAIKQTKKGHRRILVSHHPLNWLSEFSEIDLVNTIDRDFELYLYGHLHDPRPVSINSVNGQCLRNQAGALYMGRKRYNGYALISLENDNGYAVVFLRKFSDPRREFVEGVDIVPDGTFYPRKEDENFWRKHEKTVDRAMIRAWIAEKLLPATADIYNQGLVERPVCDVFVPPPMVVQRTVDSAADDDVFSDSYETPIRLSEILAEAKNYIIQGGAEYGKTTLLRQAALELMRYSIEDENRLTVPIVIQFGDIRPGRKAIHRLVSANLFAEPDGFTFETILREGCAVLLFDDVDYSDLRRIDILRSFISDYPHNRYLFTVSMQEHAAITAIGIDVVPDAETPISFDRVVMKPFTRQKMRALVNKWDSDGRLDREEVVKRLTREFASMNIPVTAVNGTILLEIYEAHSGFTPINRSVLVEQFVEHTLEKRAPEEAQRRTFDFKNKVHVLSNLAAHMAIENQYVLHQDEILKVMKKFIDNVGFSQDTKELLAEFLDAKILEIRPDDCLSFRYRAFLEYFVAYQMREESQFKEWILHEDRYLTFINEIQYYAGIVRNDKDLIDIISKRYTEITALFTADAEWTPEISRIDNFEPPRIGSREDLSHEFERQMESPPLTEEERDELLDTDLPADETGRQEVFRPKPLNIGHEWISSIFLYSGVLKNLEHIADGEKRKHLSIILKGWSMFTAFSLYIVPSLARQRKMRVNGVLYDVNMPRHYSEEKVARIIYIELPNSISRIIMGLLGTEKLARQLKEPELSEVNEPLITAFYRYSLIVDLRLPGWIKLLAGFGESVRSSTYLLEVLLRKTTDTYLLGDYKAAFEKQLKGFAAELIGNLRGTDRKTRSEEKSKALQQIQHKDAVRRLQISAQADDRDDDS